MVHDQVHKYAHSPFMCSIKDFSEKVKIPEIGMDIHIIGNVVPVIGIRRGINRGKPYGIYIQAFYIVKF